jgi:hypothetical protein
LRQHVGLTRDGAHQGRIREIRLGRNQRIAILGAGCRNQRVGERIDRSAFAYDLPFGAFPHERERDVHNGVKYQRLAIGTAGCAARTVANDRRAHDRAIANGRDPQNRQAGELIVAGIKDELELVRPWTLRRGRPQRQVPGSVLSLLGGIEALHRSAQGRVDDRLLRGRYDSRGQPGEYERAHQS